MSENAALREADFMSCVSIIASKYNCSLVDIDFKSQLVELDGEEVDIDRCIIEIKDIFHRYV